jgi:hypothetical protein
MFNATLSWLGYSVALILTMEVGYRSYLRFRRWRRLPGGEGSDFVMSTALTLLALLIAFTFSIAHSNFELRRDLVTAEATAISTTHLRHQLLENPERDRLNALMHDYVRVRLDFSTDRADPAALATVQQQTAQLQSAIWDVTDQALDTPAGQRISVSLLNATNEMFDDAERRLAAYDARIPQRIMRSVHVFALGSALLVGLTLAAMGSRHFISTSGMFVLVGLALSLISDMDNGATGLITTSQAPMERVAQVIAMERSPLS